MLIYHPCVAHLCALFAANKVTHTHNTQHTTDTHRTQPQLTQWGHIMETKQTPAAKATAIRLHTSTMLQPERRQHGTLLRDRSIWGLGPGHSQTPCRKPRPSLNPSKPMAKPHHTPTERERAGCHVAVFSPPLLVHNNSSTHANLTPFATAPAASVSMNMVAVAAHAVLQTTSVLLLLLHAKASHKNASCVSHKSVYGPAHTNHNHNNNHDMHHN